MSTTGTFTHRPLTSSSKGTFYFAYGSNLSPTQMALRCTSMPSKSAVPIAIARLHGWKWIICHSGSANLVYTGGVSQGEEEEGNEVWGVVYDISIEDEEILDWYEGVDWAIPEPLNGARAARGDGEGTRPAEQGNGRHNKLYLEVDIVEWKVKGWEEQLRPEKVRVLVYVDEYEIEEGQIRPEYIGRMNRGIGEAVELGLNEEWVARVMRRWVTDGVKAPEGYVGRHGFRPLGKEKDT